LLLKAPDAASNKDSDIYTSDHHPLSVAQIKLLTETLSHSSGALELGIQAPLICESKTWQLTKQPLNEGFRSCGTIMIYSASPGAYLIMIDKTLRQENLKRE
jgi:hypothetical protein